MSDKSKYFGVTLTTGNFTVSGMAGKAITFKAIEGEDKGLYHTQGQGKFIVGVKNDTNQIKYAELDFEKLHILIEQMIDEELELTIPRKDWDKNFDAGRTMIEAGKASPRKMGAKNFVPKAIKYIKKD